MASRTLTSDYWVLATVTSHGRLFFDKYRHTMVLFSTTSLTVLLISSSLLGTTFTIKTSKGSRSSAVLRSTSRTMGVEVSSLGSTNASELTRTTATLSTICQIASRVF